MDYQTMIVGSLQEMTATVLNFIPTLVVALAILIIGCILAHAIHKFLIQFFTLLKLDMICDRIGIVNVLKTGGITQKPSRLLASMIYIVLMFMVMIITVKAFGLPIAGDMFDTTLMFIPSVITGVILLIVGMLLAKFVSSLVFVAASNTDMPSPHVLSRLVKLSILVYVGIIFLQEIGFLALFQGANYTIFLGGIVLALALAFGLAGKGVASKYLDVLSMKKE